MKIRLAVKNGIVLDTPRTVECGSPVSNAGRAPLRCRWELDRETGRLVCVWFVEPDNPDPGKNRLPRPDGGAVAPLLAA